MVHWQVTYWTVQLPVHLTPFSGDTGSGNMTVDTMNPAAPHTTATNISALAPMMTTLMNAALSCGTKRTYHRAISSYTHFWKCNFPVVPEFPGSACVLGAFSAHLHSTLCPSYCNDLHVCYIIRSQVGRPS